MNLISIVISLFLMSCASTSYLAEQAKGQYGLLAKREDLSKVIKKKETSKELKNKLELVLEVKNFLKKDLRLDPKDSYSAYVRLDKPWVIKNLTVSEKCKVKPYKWDFPIVGKVPYLGFFNEESALKKENEFKKNGYDTNLRGVAAYSTLGWFSDPVLSTYIGFRDDYLISIIIHETVHLNIFKKNEMKFNENIAVFIEGEGTKLFLLKKYGAGSEEYKGFIKALAAEEERLTVLKGFLKEIEEYYKANKCDVIKKNRDKKFKDFEERYFKKFSRRLKLNNAFFVNIKLYNVDKSKFENEYKQRFNSDLPKFIEYYKKNSR